MFARKKQIETCISVALDELLTTDSCTKLIIELLKYILYQKQQIPFSYDTLMQLQTRFKPTDRNSYTTKTLASTLQNISENLTSQLHSNNEVREIIIIIGATMLSPKLCIRLEVPNNILNSRNHMEYQHSTRKPLLNLMKSMVDCQEFQDAMDVPLGVTNTFVLLQKSDSSLASEFFLPKPQYAPPTHMATCFVIKFHQETKPWDCNCKDLVKVYHDLPKSEENDNSNDSTCRKDFCNESRNDCSFSWYQSREVIKGFKFAR